MVDLDSLVESAVTGVGIGVGLGVASELLFGKSLEDRILEDAVKLKGAGYSESDIKSILETKYADELNGGWF